MISPGPYLSDGGDGPEVYLPTESYTWPQARHWASLMAQEIGCDVAIYQGRADCWLDGMGDDSELVPCYVFEAQERPH